MDYNQEQFFRMQMDVPKMPFYMSYPMQNLYLTEMEYEKENCNMFINRCVCSVIACRMRQYRRWNLQW